MNIEGDKTQRKDRKSNLKRVSKAPESGVVLLAALSLLVLFNPFSEELLAIAPALPFLAAFALFMVPGLVVSIALLPGPDLAGLARVPVAFALSVGLWLVGMTVVAVPAAAVAMVRGVQSLPSPPIFLGFVIVLFLGLAVVLRLVRKRSPVEEDRGRSATELSTALLWVPFSLMTGILAWISASNVPRPGEDIWVYLSPIRDSLSGQPVGGSSRLGLSAWLPEQSALSLISGLDPVALVLRFLAPTLVVVSLLALYALARTLLKSKKAALVIGSLSALFFLIGFGSLSFDSVLAPGGEFVNYITEDKFVARYVFLPVALCLAVLFVRDRSWRNLGLFLFACFSVALMHPLGLVFIGISLVGFGLVHLAINRRDRGAWRGIGGLWLALFVVIGPPALYLLATGDPLLFRLEAVDPDVAATLTENWQYEQRLLEIGEGSYIAHPSLLVDPAMLAVYLLGVPFLIWKIKQARDGLAAQLLLGVLAFVPVLTFVPFTATSISNVIGPWMLYRLTWPLLLAALLTLGWMCWEALRYAGSGLGGFGSTRRVAPFLPLIILGILLLEAISPALTALRASEDPAEIAQDESTCLDPTFRWMQGAIPASSNIMAPRTENPCIAAYTTSARVVGARGQISPQISQDLRNFYAAPALGPEALEILERHEEEYVFLPANSPLNAQLEHLPGFASMNNPGERYRVYEVTDRERAFEPTPAVAANGDLNDEEWDAAIEAYTEVLEHNPNEDEQFLAYLGLGRAYAQQEQYAEAAENYQAAAKLDPYSPTPHDLLATVYNAAGEKDQARTEFERATELDPGNAPLRLRYGQFLMPLDRREAVEQHLAVAKTFPQVPEYRVRLGATLALAGDPEAADREFERAIYLSPLSAKIRADVAGANLAIGRPLRAIEHYEEALDLAPNSQLYTLNLGKVYAQLSTQNGRDEERFEEAETLLRSVEELGHPPWEADQREAARISLGDLYLAWDRPEEAAAAYERALELNPDSREAREKLAGLRR